MTTQPHDGVDNIAPSTREQAIWNQALDDLRHQLTKSTFDLHLLGSEIAGKEGDTYVVRVDRPASVPWLEARLQDVVNRALSDVVDAPAAVRFVASNDEITSYNTPVRADGAGRGVVDQEEKKPKVKVPSPLQGFYAGKLLINEPPLQVLPTLAEIIGLSEAIFLQQLHYWLVMAENNDRLGKKHNGRWWVYNSAEEWQQKNFRFWTVRTVQRISARLRDYGLILTENLNENTYDRTLWYTIDYSRLDTIFIAWGAYQQAIEAGEKPDKPDWAITTK